jgi:hypothetical protein
MQYLTVLSAAGALAGAGAAVSMDGSSSRGGRPDAEQQDKSLQVLFYPFDTKRK